MTTSSEDLRRNAAEQVAAAEAVLVSSPRNAAYLAGYAVEFMLKARFCRKHGLPGLPADRPALKQQLAKAGLPTGTQLFTHDLQALLELSEGVRLLAGQYHRIDWARACQWTEQLRYSSHGEVTEADARELLVEVGRVVDELYCYEAIEELLPVERELTERFGLFHIFAYVIHPVTKSWHLLISYVGRNEREVEERWQALTEATERLPADIAERLQPMVALEPGHPVARSLFAMLGMVVGGIRGSPRAMFARNIVGGLPPFPDGWVVTGGNWADELLESFWARCSTADPRPKGNA